MKYQPKFPFKSGHFNTIYRKAFTNHIVNFKRERLYTSDNDFLDLDFSKVNSSKLVIIIHGLEGSSRSRYVQSNTVYFNKQGYDVCVMNLRGCSGELNHLYSSYHSGKTDDLDFIIKNVENNYLQIFLIGYSLGGNIVTKYTGEQRDLINTKIKKVVAVSVPCDLASSAVELAKPKNWYYQHLFMKDMNAKLRVKIKRFPEYGVTLDQINKIKTFNQFDNIYTSIAHGFKDAKDYWKKNSSKQFIKDIRVKTLMLNASDDSFLGKGCYPIKEAKTNPFFILEISKHGGHVGFNTSFNKNKNFWLEKRIMEFIINE